MTEDLNNKHQNLESNKFESLEIVTSNTQAPTNAQPPINLIIDTCSTNYNKITMKTLSKSFFKRKTEAQLIKENILKSRYNRRVGQLKELTQNNVQMFLRIKAQDSHYKYKTIHHQYSYKILPGKSSRVQSQSHTSTHTNSQTQLRNDDLKTRCMSLKRGLTKEFKSITISMNDTDEQVKVCKSTEIGVTRNFRIERKVERVSNKQNQGNNYVGNYVSEKHRKEKLSEIQNKVVSKKLGLLIPSKDIAMLKANNFFRRKQQKQPRGANISTQFIRRKEDILVKQRQREGLIEKIIDCNCNQ